MTMEEAKSDQKNYSNIDKMTAMMKLFEKQLFYILDEEIKWSNDNIEIKGLASRGYKLGFIAGLNQTKRIILQFTRGEK